MGFLFFKNNLFTAKLSNLSVSVYGLYGPTIKLYIIELKNGTVEYGTVPSILARRNCLQLMHK